MNKKDFYSAKKIMDYENYLVGDLIDEKIQENDSKEKYSKKCDWK
jgi:hypothetical protein